MSQKLIDYYDITLVSDDLSDTDEFICGTEYEIEDIKSIKLPGHSDTWYPTQLSLNDAQAWWVGKIGLMHDGSLRNHGIEFITKPVTFEEAIKLFDTLHKGLTLGPNPYTVRTSTHVHVNMASMTLDQCKHMMLLYALLEPVFFAAVAPDRQHNIHCVPLNYTLLPSIYKSPFPDIVKSWSKYSALNLMPLRTQGTMEFRHLHGTGDIVVYQRWLTLLNELWTFAFMNPPSTLEKMLRSGATPQEICGNVLPSASFGGVDFSTSLIDVKLAF